MGLTLGLGFGSEEREKELEEEGKVGKREADGDEAL